MVTSLAGFAGDPLPQAPGGRIAIPAAFRYPAAVSRRILVAFWIRRSDQPNWPSAMTCFLFSSFKTLLTWRRISLHRIQCPESLFLLAGFQVTAIGRFWVTAEVDPTRTSALSHNRPAIHFDKHFLELVRLGIQRKKATFSR